MSDVRDQYGRILHGIGCPCERCIAVREETLKEKREQAVLATLERICAVLERIENGLHHWGK